MPAPPARPAAPAIATAFWWTAPLRGELRAEAVAAPGPGELGLRTLWSGVSRGTEALVARGRVPASEWERMRCPNQAGAFPFPVKYGYAAVAEVEAGPPDLLGRTVFALHPHQDRFVLPIAAATLVPKDVPPARAVLAANMETALNGLWDAGLLPGDRVVIVGAGVVGALVARLAAGVVGVEPTLVDIDPGKAALAAALGVAFRAPDDTPGDADLVIEASGTEGGLVTALALAGFEATVLALGWHGSETPALPLGGAFHSRRLRLVSSQVGWISARQRARWTHARRLAKVMQLLADPALDALFSGESRFAELPRALPAALQAQGTLCHRIRYD